MTEPNALAPEAMRQEFINIVVNQSHARLSHDRAGKIVDSILEKQMQFYAAMAEPEVDMVEAAQVVSEVKGIVEALIRQGASVCEFMPDKAKWQSLAARARDLCAKLEGLIE